MAMLSSVWGASWAMTAITNLGFQAVILMGAAGYALTGVMVLVARRLRPQGECELGASGRHELGLDAENAPCTAQLACLTFQPRFPPKTDVPRSFVLADSTAVPWYAFCEGKAHDFEHEGNCWVHGFRLGSALGGVFEEWLERRADDVQLPRQGLSLWRDLPLDGRLQHVLVR